MDKECEAEIKKSAKEFAGWVWEFGVAIDVIAGVLLVIFLVARAIR